MSVIAAKWAKRQRVRTTCRIVLGALADRADKQGQCWPSQATIAADTGLAVRTVRLVLAELTTAEVIQRVPRGNRFGGRATDLITLNLGRDFDLLTVIEVAPEELPFAADDATKGGEGYRQIKDGLAAYEGRVSGTTCRGKNLTGTQRNLYPSREETFQEKALYGGAPGAAPPDPFGDDAFGPTLHHGEDHDDWDLHDVAEEDAR
ncbi:helix-turn-helix domain-containing protein [Methylobacterium sp. J-068]|uniref:helix-turn-helix domain-containing protein n=1 Tax=Methylobacterium sp. J-068 TaxID=2836649 RepID=UPI001FBB4C83|nr:helix-turn-helix domain-containing protein [Methylobacterium sp. J-068]MCJ2034530.1 helix-turn-helix domain-containing protein [Methylobacterium sp. J-068]